MNITKRLDWTRIAVLAILVLGGVIVQLGGCNREQPTQRTEEYYALHGLVPGQVNELQIGEYKFRFPAENFPEPYTDAKRASDIVKGRAERATVHLDLSSWPLFSRHSYFQVAERATVHLDLSSWFIEKPPGLASEATTLVRVEHWPRLNSGGSMKAAQEAKLKTEPWKAIDDLPQIGLRRYMRATDGWGELTYLPTDSSVKTSDGALMLYDCTAILKSTADGKLPLATDQPYICHLSFRHPRGPYIAYFFSGRLLPRWKEVHQEVLNFVGATLIKN